MTVLVTFPCRPMAVACTVCKACGRRCDSAQGCSSGVELQGGGLGGELVCSAGHLRDVRLTRLS